MPQGRGRFTLPSQDRTSDLARNLMADAGDAANEWLANELRQRRSWHTAVTGYTGYGAPGWARVFGRAMMSRPRDERRPPPELVRGWRSFFTLPIAHTEVSISAGGREHVVATDSEGLIDQMLEFDLPPGWQHVTMRTEGSDPVQVPVNIVGPQVRTGMVSDIDDTVMVTTLPRAALAAWNTFVMHEHARRPVPGMAVMYERFVRSNPGAPVIYLSTGAWNVAPTLTRFLSRHLYPSGPLLLTDWGPTRERWFRSGTEHKRAQLSRLAQEFPNIEWLLVGDDGQHDPDLYSEFAKAHPAQVAAVAIRHLSPTEQVFASGLSVPMEQARAVPGTVWVSSPHGAGLAKQLEAEGLLQQPWED